MSSSQPVMVPEGHHGSTSEKFGEIEAALVRHPAIREAVVTRHMETAGAPRLAAFVVRDREAGKGAAREEVAERLRDWRASFDQMYGSGPAGDPTFDTAGWVSAYTSEVMAVEEMREWVDETVRRILGEGPRRVLEIGSGTGLLLYRIAPHVSHYRARDLSRSATANVFRQLAGSAELAHVRAEEFPAHNFTGVASGGFDAVVVNSVAQYFPSVEYLLDVIEKAVDAVADGGFVYLGDVRSLSLLKTFHASVELFRAEGSLPVPELRRRIERRVRDEEELVVDPAFFVALRHHLPRIRNVRVLPRRGQFHNEMTLFRYDVILKTEDMAKPAPEWDDEITWQGWQTSELGLPAMRGLLPRIEGPLALRDVPNARLSSEASLLCLLAAENVAELDVSDLRQRLGPQRGIDPELLWRLTDELGCCLEVNWAETGETGTFDAMIHPHHRPPVSPTVFPAERACQRPWSVYANQPLRSMRVRRFGARLESYLHDCLPDGMVPSEFVVLESLPLTPGGQVDRAALEAVMPT